MLTHDEICGVTITTGTTEPKEGENVNAKTVDEAATSAITYTYSPVDYYTINVYIDDGRIFSYTVNISHKFLFHHS